MPAAGFVTGDESKYWVWETPFKVPGMASVLTKQRQAREDCNGASRGCEHASRSCDLGELACTEPQHACVNREARCAEVLPACRPLRDGAACPGFTTASDPVLRLLRSPVVAALTGLQPGDEVRFAGVVESTSLAYVTYQHFVTIAPAGTPQRIPVMGSTLVIHTDVGGHGVLALTSHLAAGFVAPEGSLVSESDAKAAAVEHLIGQGVEVAPDGAQDVKLVAVRVEARESESSDHLAYAMTFQPSEGVAGAAVLIDANDQRLLAGDLIAPLKFQVIPGPVKLVQVPAIDKLITCWTDQGNGKDRFGSSREFSTSLLALGEPPMPVNYTFGTASCGELDDSVGWRDVVTFSTGASGKLPQGSDVSAKDLFTSKTNSFTDSSAVEAQHWGEKAIRYLKTLGVKERKTVAVKDGALIPIRMLMAPNAPVDNGEWSAPVLDLVNVAPYTTVLQEGNGQVLFGAGDGTKDGSWTGPSVIAHELFHSVVWDHVTNGGKLSATASDEYAAIFEGLSECFEMLFIHAHKSQMAFDQVPPDPFHLASDVFKLVGDQELGDPNLANPRESVFGGRRSWRGDWDGSGARHANATLLSGVCKLLVTGGHNPDPIYKTWAVTPGSAVTHALGWSTSGGLPDQELGYQRLERLLIETVVSGGLKPSADFHAVIDALAAKAEALNINQKWGMGFGKAGERIRRAFGAYGWGRGEEGEPNEVANMTSGDAEAKNVVGVGNKYSRTISGDVCCQEEDFLVLSEKVQGGATLSWTINKGKHRVRVFVDEPCSFFAGGLCPGLIFPLNSGEEPPAESGSATLPSGIRRRVYFGVSPAIDPSSGAPMGGDYKLTVTTPAKTY